MLASNPRQDRKQRTPKAAMLELVDHGDSDLGDVRVNCAVVARHPDDPLFSTRPVRRGDERKSIVVVDDREPVCERIRKPFQGREESEVDGPL